MALMPSGHPNTPNEDDDIGAQVDEVTRDMELSDPDAGASRFDRMVNRTAEAFGVFLLALLTGLVFLNAFARYAFSHSFIWGDELIISMIPWLAMAGLFLAVRRRNVIRIDVFVEMMPAAVRHILRLAGELLSALVFAYLGYVSIQYVRLFGGDTLTYLRWPTGIFSISFVIGPLLAALAYLVTFWREAREGQASTGREAAT